MRVIEQPVAFIPKMLCCFAGHWWFYIYRACAETSAGTFLTPKKCKRFSPLFSRISIPWLGLVADVGLSMTQSVNSATVPLTSLRNCSYYVNTNVILNTHSVEYVAVCLRHNHNYVHDVRQTLSLPSLANLITVKNVNCVTSVTSYILGKQHCWINLTLLQVIFDLSVSNGCTFRCIAYSYKNTCSASFI